MTEADIAELFIHVAGIERRLPGYMGDGPRQYGGYPLPVTHTFADMNGWSADPVRRDPERPLYRWDRFCKLLDNDRQRHAAHRREFWEGRTLRVSAEDMTMWEACLAITIERIENPDNRRALWAWAFAQAGGRSFAKWCRQKARISEMTGHRRKNRALREILARLASKPDLLDGNGHFGVLRCEPENGHVFATIEGQRVTYDTAPVHKLSWKDDPAFAAGGLTKADVLAAERRQRERERGRAKRAA